ncbi:MAG: AAA family ATPase [bacterium]|nr:AAA family ATPase [bacterium]MDZ4284236.1 AAA family ATPase [Patescibacteria group bacterium]
MITRKDAERFVLPEFGMDPNFPEEAECSAEHARHLLQVIWPQKYSYDRVLVAQEPMRNATLMGMFAVGDTDLDHLGPGHVFYLGLPGTGKTLFAKVPAKVVRASTARFQGTPDALPSDFTGNRIIDISENDRRYFRLIKGPGFSFIVVLDEINRTTPRTQSAFLELMSEGTITIAGETHTVPSFIIATANPLENEGVFPMSEALLDRFMFLVRAHAFTADQFTEILRRSHEFQNIELRAVCDETAVLKIREFFFNTVHVPKEVEERIGRFAEITNSPRAFGCLTDLADEIDDTVIISGLQGRGETHLLGAARIFAAIFKYRNYVTPDDVRAVMLPVLRHRIVFRKGVLRHFRTLWKQDSILDTVDTIIKRLIHEAW